MIRLLFSFFAFALILSCGSEENNSMRFDKLNSPHFITESIELEKGVDFIVEAGAHLIISDGVELSLKGRVIMIGTKSDSIIIDPLTPGVGWNRLVLKSDFSKLVMSHVRMTDGIIMSLGTENDIQNCVFHNSQDLDWESAMVRCLGGSLHISSCKFYGINLAEGLLVHNIIDANIRSNYFYKTSDAIELIGSAYGRIHDNVIEFPGDDGIDLNNCKYVDINDNVIENAGDSGMEIGSENFGSTMETYLEDNIILDCEKGIWLKESSNAYVLENRFENNGIAVEIITNPDSIEVSSITLEQCDFINNLKDVKQDDRSKVEIIN